MTNEEKQELIADCEASIELLKIALRNGTSDTPHYVNSELMRQEIALAALTAQPVKLPDPYGMQDHERWLKQSEVESAIRAAGYEVQE